MHPKPSLDTRVRPVCLTHKGVGNRAGGKTKAAGELHEPKRSRTVDDPWQQQPRMHPTNDHGSGWRPSVRAQLIISFSADRIEVWVLCEAKHVVDGTVDGTVVVPGEVRRHVRQL
ncbi:hypothetical protein ZHAS_00006016 [Anopheles sinensis]|uniref:Uncharacterized protein n=1 Tax=Anopheles sinensis TaxID=74873 RepID=A0A084VKY5_ANOSI|nr:hypothetical protein ZHAS_00006016 [Anopheles sinensis]